MDDHHHLESTTFYEALEKSKKVFFDVHLVEDKELINQELTRQNVFKSSKYFFSKNKFNNVI